MRRIGKWIKRRFKRLGVKFVIAEKNSKLLKPEGEKTNYEKVCLSICRKLINHPDSILDIKPSTQTKFILNKTIGISIEIQDQNVEITNHVYHYYIKLDVRDSVRLKHMFDTKKEQIIDSYQEEIKSQKSSTLVKILERIDNHK